jgi:hypothetical protein
MADYRPAELSEDGYFQGNAHTVLLEPEKWVGKRLPLLKHIDIGDELAHGHWLLVLYRHDCPKCEKLIPRFEQAAIAATRESAMARFVLVELPPYAESGVGPVSRGSPCRLGRLSETKKWVVTTPTTLSLEAGIVYAAQVGAELSVPSYTKHDQFQDSPP